MKKVLLVTGVAVFAVAALASAAFSTNLTVGSTGSDVVALQTWLITNGFHIASIESGAANKGYFGSQTKAALAQYQTSVGLPAFGFFGPLTQAKLNGGATGVATNNCMTGWTAIAYNGTNTCLPPGYTVPAGATVVNTTPAVGSNGTTITTPGIPGIMSVTAGPISSTVLNVGAQMAPVLAIRVQAQYSDLSVQSLNLDLGNNTAIYNKIINKVYVTDGTNVLASQPLNSSTVIQSGSDYIVGLAGFNFIVPKGTYKDIVIKADLNSSIDSAYTSTAGAHYPNVTNGYNSFYPTTNLSGWVIGLSASNGLRAVDGAGINLNSGSGFYQQITINPSLVDNAQANISLNSASPLSNSIPVTDTTNNQYLGLPVLIFDVNAQNDNVHLHDVKVNVGVSGAGTVGAAYLLQGSTQIASASIVGGVAEFANITDGTNGATIPVNTTLSYTVKVDVTGVTAATTVTASTSATQVIYSSNDSSVILSGAANGNPQIVSSTGPLFTLVGAPSITKQVTNTDQNGNATSTYTATFNIQAQSIGTDVAYGLLSSSSPAFAIGNAVVYQTIAGVQSTTTLAALGGSVTYNQPTNTSLNNAGDTFTVSRNSSVSIPVTYTFQVKNPGSNTYAVQLKQVNVSPSGVINFMNGQVAWRTASN